MSWTVITKIEQSEEEREIQTPDLFQILVGANEDEVLIYQDAFNNWGLPSKAEEDWSLPSKIIS